MERLQARDAESQEQALRMIAAQSTRAERLALADDVIHNDGSLDQAMRQVDELHARYLSLATSARESS